jgi:hypothetical protein
MIVLIIKIKETFGLEEQWINTHIEYDGEHRDWTEMVYLVERFIPISWHMVEYKWQKISDQ